MYNFITTNSTKRANLSVLINISSNLFFVVFAAPLQVNTILVMLYSQEVFFCVQPNTRSNRYGPNAASPGLEIIRLILLPFVRLSHYNELATSFIKEKRSGESGE